MDPTISQHKVHAIPVEDAPWFKDPTNKNL